MIWGFSSFHLMGFESADGFWVKKAPTLNESTGSPRWAATKSFCPHFFIVFYFHQFTEAFRTMYPPPQKKRTWYLQASFLTTSRVQGTSTVRHFFPYNFPGNRLLAVVCSLTAILCRGDAWWCKNAGGKKWNIWRRHKVHIGIVVFWGRSFTSGVRQDISARLFPVTSKVLRNCHCFERWNWYLQYKKPTGKIKAWNAEMVAKQMSTAGFLGQTLCREDLLQCHFHKVNYWIQSWGFLPNVISMPVKLSRCQ